MLLHHIGIVVDKLDEAIPLFQVWMNARPIGTVFEDEVQGARIQLLFINGDSLLELIEPLPGPDRSYHHTGEYHLCFTVPDLDAEMARLHDMGTVITHPVATAQHFDNHRIGFLATQYGQLLELLEESDVPVQ